MHSRFERAESMSRLLRTLASAACVTMAVVAANSLAATVEVAAGGLANPRGITLGPGGQLLVAEAGAGGIPATMTGHVSEVLPGGRVRRVLTMQSTLVQGGADVSGPTNVATFGGLGGLVVTMGAGPGVPFGMLLGANPGRSTFVADITAYELENNPDGVVPPDSNPYGVAVTEEGAVLVADAAANDLLYVTPDGAIELVAVFPAAPNVLFPGIGGPTVQAVPTSVAVGPDGAWYVGELRGFPFNNASHIWRIEPGTRNVRCVIGATTGPCIDWATGLRHVVGIAFGPDGHLYASQFGPGPGPGFLPNWSTPGAVVRVDMSSKAIAVVHSGLTAPGGVAVDAHGDIYVTNQSTSTTLGEVLRITP